MLIGFIYKLREYGIKASLPEYLDFIEGIRKQLAPDLDSLFILARLCFVRHVKYYDSFERAFAEFFEGIKIPRVDENDLDLVQTPEFREWLNKAVYNGELPAHPSMMPLDELMQRFWETVKEQSEEHHGGSKWVGTGGTSPWGHSGSHPGGIRVHGQGRSFSAAKVIGERRYLKYSHEQKLSRGNFSEALERLKNLQPVGSESELDLSETLRRTERAGGEIELVFRKEKRNDLDVILLMDNGGYSMLPHITICTDLFRSMNEKFHRLNVYYFHNLFYEWVYRDEQRRRPFSTFELLKKNPDSRVFIVGDASFSPTELLSPMGSINLHEESPDPGEVWLKRLLNRFEHTVWLNPLPRDTWAHTRGAYTIHRVKEIIPMFDLTLGGIEKAVTHLNNLQSIS